MDIFVRLFEIGFSGFALAGGVGSLCYALARRRWLTMAVFACISFLIAGNFLANYFLQSATTPEAMFIPIRLKECSGNLVLLLLPFLYRVLWAERPAWSDYLVTGFFVWVVGLALLRPYGFEWDHVTGITHNSIIGTNYPVGVHSRLLLPIRVGQILVDLYYVGIAWRGWRSGHSRFWIMAAMPVALLGPLIYTLGDALGLWHVTFEAGPPTSLLLYLILGSSVFLSERTFLVERDTLYTSLVEREAKLAALTGAGLSLAGLLDPEGRIVFANNAALRLLGIDAKQVLGVSFAQAPWWGHSPPMQERVRIAIDEAMAGRSVRLDVTVRDEESKEVALDFSLSPYYGPDGKICYLVVEAHDISDRVRAEMTLRESQQRLKLLHEVSIILAKQTSSYDLCRLAVEAVREQFAFDRASLWLIDETDQFLMGTCGTDENGRSVDEWGKRIPLDPHWRETAHLTGPVIRAEDAVRVDRGELAVAGLLDRKRFIGTIFADNGMSGKAIDASQLEVLGLFGLTVGNLFSRLEAEMAMRDSEARFRSIFTQSAIGMVILDPEGNLLESNAAMRSMLEFTKEELHGRPFRELIHPDDLAYSTHLNEEIKFGKRESYELDKRYIRKNGQILWAHVTATLIRDANGNPQFAVRIAQDITERIMAAERLRESLEQVQMLSRRIEQLREEERARVAREIHDELGQALTALKIQLSWLRNQMSRQTNAPSSKTLLDKTDEMNIQIDQSIQAVRRIATALRPAILDALGLVPALEWQTQEFEKRTGIVCDFYSDLETVSLGAEAITAIFRIVQESLTNVMRHAQATCVHVRVENPEERLIVTIEDDGIGIQEAKHEVPQSFGLLSMRERALLLGGDLQITGIVNRGTTVRLQIPYSSP